MMTAAAVPVEEDPKNQSNGKLTNSDRIRFLVGFFICGFFWACAFISASTVLMPQRFKDEGIAHPETLVGQISSVGAIVALVANIVLGALSDRNRSRLGRRTPFIIGGALVAGISIYLAYMCANPGLIILAWCGVQIGLNAMLAPFVATMSDRIPEDGRATASAVYGVGLSVGGALGTLVGARFVTSQGAGFLLSAIMMAVTGVLVIIVWPKEGSAANIPRATGSFKAIAMSFVPPTKNARDFYLALFGRLVLAIGASTTGGFILYILEGYVKLSAADAAKALALISMINMVVSAVASLLAGYISDRLHRRKAMMIACAAIYALSYLFPFFWPSIPGMIVAGVIGGFALGIYNACDGALNVDVLPNKEQAAKDLGILNLSNTVGQAVGPLITSQLFNAFHTYRPVYAASFVIVLLSVIFIFPIRKAK